MAMIKCPDCKTPISDTAECCPRCGCKFRADYERMQNLRKYIYEEEYGVKVRPVATSYGGGSLVFALCMLGVVVFGVLLLINANSFGQFLLALACIGVGGMLFLGGIGIFLSDLERNKRSRGDVAYFDRQQAERPERIARMKRELAQLEAKFR